MSEVKSNPLFKGVPELAVQQAAGWVEGEEVLAVVPQGDAKRAYAVVSKAKGFYSLYFVFNLAMPGKPEQWVVSADVVRGKVEDVFAKLHQRME